MNRKVLIQLTSQVRKFILEHTDYFFAVMQPERKHTDVKTFVLINLAWIALGLIL